MKASSKSCIFYCSIESPDPPSLPSYCTSLQRLFLLGSEPKNHSRWHTAADLPRHSGPSNVLFSPKADYPLPLSHDLRTFPWLLLPVFPFVPSFSAHCSATLIVTIIIRRTGREVSSFVKEKTTFSLNWRMMVTAGPREYSKVRRRELCRPMQLLILLRSGPRLYSWSSRWRRK